MIGAFGGRSLFTERVLKVVGMLCILREIFLFIERNQTACSSIEGLVLGMPF